MSKWIRAGKAKWGFAAYLTLFNKINFYCGLSDSWGIAIEYSFYDRSLTFKILNLYAGFEVYHGE
jgi:hypothetical protein